MGGCLSRNYFFSSFFSFSSASTTFLPQRSHLPSSVIQGCLGASPPQIPHFGICHHLPSILPYRGQCQDAVALTTSQKKFFGLSQRMGSMSARRCWGGKAGGREAGILPVAGQNDAAEKDGRDRLRVSSFEMVSGLRFPEKTFIISGVVPPCPPLKRQVSPAAPGLSRGQLAAPCFRLIGADRSAIWSP
jgi:hypothetical protein